VTTASGNGGRSATYPDTPVFRPTADRLAALVDDVHFAARIPKHLIMGALVNVVDRHRVEVEAETREAGGTA
jgi:hypothetical protein